ncbi:MAG: hypothetical protein QXV69_03115 [Sulfolobaceae archaeon]
MSIINDPEFVELRKYRGTVDKEILRKILTEIEEDYRKSKNLRLSILYIYSFYMSYISKNRQLFNLISVILEKYSQKLGVENLCNLIIEMI